MTYTVPQELLEIILEKAPYDLIVGIPSYNNAETIRYVTETAAKGLTEFFPGYKACIINSDGGSSDETRETFLKSNTGNVDLYSFVYEGISGKGTAMRSILEIAAEAGAKAVVFLDSDLRSVQPFWIERLINPILSGKTSYVTPYYIRHKYDGTITNSICYPLTSTLYGQKVRQPIGGDFGVGREMIEIYTNKDPQIWESDISRFGIDIWMTTTAINESKLPVYQASLGAKIHDVKDPGKQLGKMFKEVVGTLFSLMETYKNNWSKTSSLKNSPIYGEFLEITPEPINVDIDNLINSCKKGITNNKEEIESIFSYEISEKIFEIASSSGRVDEDTWISVIFELSNAYRKPDLRDKIIKILVPIYFGKTADFVIKTTHMNQKEAEKEIEKLLEKFIERKGELTKIWKI
ncbi:glycosyltransferase [Thermosipho ferrireducens]|uniref:Glycosyltransferase n=1 Tax=Thermosipho ferrireducens TaxID=2571116 RepID=A0ABX7S7Y7_9BACT|nr:glycosyltransferase [Thermosipho ferrireducens]QTA38324.1 glycosyltransferase [Thermosipho ferrireducens]